MDLSYGGYAKFGEIDGTEEEVDNFNFFQALDYYGAVVSEEFELIGEDLSEPYYWNEFMSETRDHILYDGEAEQDVIDNLDNMVNGTIITIKNRTFIAAAREHGWTQLADELSESLQESNKGKPKEEDAPKALGKRRKKKKASNKTQRES